MNTSTKIIPNWKRRSILAILAAVVLPFSAIATQREVLDLQGSFYQIRSTTYGEAAPGGYETTPETSVLVLDITLPNGECHHEIVPRSLGQETDTEEQVFFDNASKTIFALWIQKGAGTDEVRLSLFQEGAWVADYQLSEPQSSNRKNLDSIFSRQFVVPTGSDAMTDLPVLKTVLQVAWWESNSSGGSRTCYLPAFIQGNGLIETANAIVYDPSTGVRSNTVCPNPLPDAAFFPSIVRESRSQCHISFFSTSVCRFLVAPITFGSVESGNGDPSQARHIPFIGLTTNVITPPSIPGNAIDSRLQTSDGNGSDYQIASSWKDDTGFQFQIYSPSDGTWGPALRIPLKPGSTTEQARSLVNSLLNQQ